MNTGWEKLSKAKKRKRKLNGTGYYHHRVEAKFLATLHHKQIKNCRQKKNRLFSLVLSTLVN